MGKADIHIHSEYSDGMASVEEILEDVEHRTDLDLIAITDHDMFDGSDVAGNSSRAGIIALGSSPEWRSPRSRVIFSHWVWSVPCIPCNHSPKLSPKFTNRAASVSSRTQ